jgi:hypothetical protein
VVRGGPQAVSEIKNKKIISAATERMKNITIRVCAKTAFVG